MKVWYIFKKDDRGWRSFTSVCANSARDAEWRAGGDCRAFSKCRLPWWPR